MKALFTALVMTAGLGMSAANAETVTIATGEWEPYLGEDLKGGGPVAELVSAAFKNQGWDVSFEYFPWKRGFEMTSSGKIDASIVWSRNDERAAEVNFSDPVINLDTVIFHTKGSPVEWQNESDLKNVHMGGVIGYDYGFVKEEDGYNLSRVSEAASNYKKMVSGRVDAVLEERLVGQQIVKELGVGDKVVTNPKPIKSKPYFLVVGKENPRHAEILDTFNRGLEELRANGQYDTILDR
ncbi:transporter substrate-binding domain-containing protein [Marinobacter sp. CHS3-4]|uniref:substrate-binding periplasmic protein n=1 Tax=Marinobacter sp. CHS3-4 TaxID=3045174 RepID=UPI0024B59689|nr:transporter substrate-binding domain-containing protein [Marinobacter sp. CHS3-4]MDI9244614.1 transporter substrate-binding domain-containing protein [Marinobacter sp. CHS3-4]